MRDTRKNRTYFDTREAQLVQDLASYSQNIDNPRVLPAMVSTGCSLVSVRYSRGDSHHSIGDTVRELCEYYCQTLEATLSLAPSESLRVAALLVPYGNTRLRQATATVSVGTKHANVLNQALWEMKPIDGTDFSDVAPLFQPYAEALTSQTPMAVASASMFEWLDKGWYPANKDQGWHDRHKADTVIYEGYWCFEAAAVARIRGFNTTGWDSSPYWPADLPV